MGSEEDPVNFKQSPHPLFTQISISNRPEFIYPTYPIIWMQLDSLVFAGKSVFYFWKHLRLPLHQRKLNYSKVRFGCLAILLTLCSKAIKHFEL